MNDYVMEPVSGGLGAAAVCLSVWGRQGVVKYKIVPWGEVGMVGGDAAPPSVLSCHPPYP